MKPGAQDNKVVDLEPGADKEYITITPTSKRSISKPLKDDEKDEHKIVGPIYERPQLKGEYDLNLINDVIHQSKRFGHIKPVALFKILGEHRNYNYFKKFAIGRLEETLHKQLLLFYQLNYCEQYEFEPEDELAHSIFSWSWNDFLTRRRLNDFVWVDVMQRTNSNCLHIYTFQMDLEQFKFYMDKIFDVLNSNFDENHEGFDVYQHVERPLDEAKKVLHTSDFLEDELSYNSRLYSELRQKEQFITGAKRESQDKFLQSYLDNQIMSSHIWNPIEVRYHLNWFNNIVDQNKDLTKYLQEKYQSDIANYSRMVECEKFIVGNCMDFYYSCIEDYKNRLNDMQVQYDKEVEAMDNKLAYKRNQIQKLREHRKWLTEEIECFHEEEKLMQEREEREARRREQARVEAEELAAKISEKKKVKGKKKKIAKPVNLKANPKK